MQLENNKGPILKIQHSGGTGTSSCLVHNVMNYQIDKKQKQTNKPAYQLPTTVLFLLQSLLLVTFSFFVLSVFWGGVIGCGEGDQLPLLYSVFIYSSLYSLHFELSRISPRVSLDSLLYHLFLRHSSITVHFRRSTHLLFMISWCTFHSPEGFARRVPLSSIRCNKG